MSTKLPPEIDQNDDVLALRKEIVAELKTLQQQQMAKKETVASFNEGLKTIKANLDEKMGELEVLIDSLRAALLEEQADELLEENQLVEESNNLEL